MIKTTLIISTYNWPEALDLCLKSVANQTILPDEIIIADDGSTSETKVLVEYFSNTISVPVKHVWHEDKGFRLARIRNLAIKNSENDYLIFIDGDVILHKDFVNDHLKNQKSGRFITGSRVLLSEHETKKRFETGKTKFVFPCYFGKNKLNGIHSTFLSKIFSKNNTGLSNLRGCNMSFLKDDLQKINGFDERFVGWGREDSDIVYRMLQLGSLRYKLKFEALQYHLFHKTLDRSSVKKNDLLLGETIRKKKIFADIGLAELN